MLKLNSLLIWPVIADRFVNLAGTETCNDDLACLTMAAHDRLGLEAIKSLHSQLDDDANGNVDLSESDDVSVLVLLLFLLDVGQFSRYFLHPIHLR